jgi:replicative DNA helicase
MISIKEGIKDFREYYNKVKDGYNPGILTPYDNINRALFNGIPKNTVSCISGHSGRGKTTLGMNIVLNAPKLNNDLEVLAFSLEMPVKSLMARNASTKLRMSVKEIYNSDIELEDDLFADIEDLPIWFDTEGGTAEEMFKKINNFCAVRPGKEILVAVDHTLLVEGTDDNEKIAQLCFILNKLKLKWPNLTSIILSQLNDAMLKEERLNKKGVLLFPQYTDLMNGRKLWQVCDTVIALNMPSDYINEVSSTHKEYEKEYGGLPLFHKKTGKKIPIIYAHIVKGRDTGTEILSFVNALKYNELIEQ